MKQQKSTLTGILLSGIILLTAGCRNGQSSTELNLQTVGAGNLLSEVEQHRGQKAVLVNFWATWCQPCVEEFPDIVDLKEKYRDSLEVYFVSGDFPENRAQVLQFLKDQGLHGDQYIVNNPQTAFFDSIHSAWTGAIPFTIIYDRQTGAVTDFWEGKATYQQFDAAVQAALN